MSLWHDHSHPVVDTDSEPSALHFIQSLLFRAWNEVLEKWKLVLGCAEEHLASVDTELSDASFQNDLRRLQILVHDIGQDSATWSTLIRLLRNQQSFLRKTRTDIRELIKEHGFQESKDKDPLADILVRLEMFEQRVAGEFREQTKNLTGLVGRYLS
ncbi:MAG: hypothetical protein Q9167_001004 [Letrouitia subvulpina]